MASAKVLLVRTPTPAPTESFKGFLLRVSEANGYRRMRYTAIIAGIGYTALTRPNLDTAKRLCAVLGRSEDSLDLIVNASKGDVRSRSLLLGEPLNSLFLRLREPRFCPECVVDKGYLDAHWDMRLVVACPVHRRRLIEKCSDCGEAIDWDRPGLLRCSCGGDLSSFRGEPIDDAVSDLVDIVVRKITKQVIPASYPSGFPTNSIAKLTLSAVSNLLLGLGGFAAYGVSPRGIQDGDVLMRNAATVLADWPNGLYQLLDRLDKTSEAINSVGYIKAFPQFYNYFFRKRSHSPEMGFIRDEFVKFGMARWDRGIFRPRVLGESATALPTRFISLVQAAEQLGIDARTLKLYIRDGVIPAQQRTVGGARRCIIAAESLSSFSRGRNGLRLRHAAAYLSIPMSVMAELRRSGCYQVRHLSAIRTYDRKDLNAFRDQLLIRAPRLPAKWGDARAISLEKVLIHLKPRSRTAKAELLAAILDGSITPLGRAADTIPSIQLDAQTVHSFLMDRRSAADLQTRSITEAAEMIGCRSEIIKPLAEAGHLRPIAGPDRVRISEDSIVAFRTKYSTLVEFARRLGVSSQKAEKLCHQHGVEPLNIRGAGSAGSQLFVARGAESGVLADTATMDTRDDRRSGIDQNI